MAAAQTSTTAVPANSSFQETYTGPVNVTIADDFAHGTSTTTYSFLQNGVEVNARLRPGTTEPDIRCGDVVRLQGFRSATSMEIVGATRVSPSRRISRLGVSAVDEEPACSPVGPQRVGVILVTFPRVPAPAITSPALQQMLFDPSSFSSNTWYRQASYDKVSFSGDVYGPYTLDRAYSCTETGSMRAAAIQAADRDIDFTRYQRYVLIFPAIAGCGWGGQSTLGCEQVQTNEGSVRSSWIWANFTIDSGYFHHLLNHEMGHSLGVRHSRLLRFPGTALEADDYRAVPLEYGDPTATMGGGRYGDFAAAHKLQLSWLEPESDVTTVSSDGEFRLAPLNQSSGVRGLRIRRPIESSAVTPGAEEWLWLEYRRAPQGGMVASPLALPTRVGFGGGILIRRETQLSAGATHLLDMTPATLDDARIDQGASSESLPELLPGQVWTDPHSALSIQAGEGDSDGITVTVRYDAACAGVPTPQPLIFTPEVRELVVSSACGPEVSSGRSWLSMTSVDPDAASATIRASEAPDVVHRRGVVTLGRRSMAVLQKGPPRDLQLIALTPPVADLPLESPVPFFLHLRDENGPEEIRAFSFSLVPRSVSSSSAPCFFRYAVARRMLEVGQDGIEFRDSEEPLKGFSGACSLQVGLIQPSPTDVYFRLHLSFAGPAGEAVTFSVRGEDLDGQKGPWLTLAELNTAQQCRTFPEDNFMNYSAGGATNQFVTLLNSPTACAWTANSDVEWIRLRSTAGVGTGALRFDVSPNPEPTSREGHVLIDGINMVRITQYGNGEVIASRVTLRPVETVVSSFTGFASLSYFYGLADLIPAFADVDWLRVTRVIRDADRREVEFLFSLNPDSTPRLGTITVGGKQFTVLQQGKP